jgi:hypothetical protein
MQQITIYSEEFELAAQQGVVVVRDRHQACGISRRSTILTGVALHGSHADKPFTFFSVFLHEVVIPSRHARSSASTDFATR